MRIKWLFNKNFNADDFNLIDSNSYSFIYFIYFAKLIIYVNNF